MKGEIETFRYIGRSGDDGDGVSYFSFVCLGFLFVLWFLVLCSYVNNGLNGMDFRNNTSDTDEMTLHADLSQKHGLRARSPSPLLWSMRVRW